MKLIFQFIIDNTNSRMTIKCHAKSLRTCENIFKYLLFTENKNIIPADRCSENEIKNNYGEEKIIHDEKLKLSKRFSVMHLK